MNKEFVKKMIKAKKLEYEAIKEIMPETIKNRIDSFQKEAFNLIKDVAIEIIKEDMQNRNTNKSECDIDNETNTTNKNIKKISVDFN